MQDLNVECAKENRERRYIEVDGQLANLDGAIRKLEGFVDSLGEPTPQPETKDCGVSAVHSFVSVYHGLTKNIVSLTERVHTIRHRLDEIIV